MPYHALIAADWDRLAAICFKETNRFVEVNHVHEFVAMMASI